MSYIANHYVSIDGEMFMAGEVIPEGLPEEKISWLMKAGAIHKVAPASVAGEPEDDGEEEPEDMQTDEETEPEDDGGVEPEDEPAPEIDAMAGIVQGEDEAPAKKPVRRASTSTKKRTTKGGKSK